MCACILLVYNYFNFFFFFLVGSFDYHILGVADILILFNGRVIGVGEMKRTQASSGLAQLLGAVIKVWSRDNHYPLFGTCSTPIVIRSKSYC